MIAVTSRTFKMNSTFVSSMTPIEAAEAQIIFDRMFTFLIVRHISKGITGLKGSEEL